MVLDKKSAFAFTAARKISTITAEYIVAIDDVCRYEVLAVATPDIADFVPTIGCALTQRWDKFVALFFVPTNASQK